MVLEHIEPLLCATLTPQMKSGYVMLTGEHPATPMCRLIIEVYRQRKNKQIHILVDNVKFALKVATVENLN